MAVQWTEQYNVHRAVLANGALELVVAWNSTAPKGSPSGFTVRAGPRKLKALAETADQGKAAAIRLAKKMVDELQIELEGA